MLSVAICTYNRSVLLSRALDSVVKQTLGEEFEILVVDNGSTDNTRDVVGDHQSKDSRIRYVAEPKPGIAHARNRALNEARGEYLAFIDDDAWAETNWLMNLTAPLRTVRPLPECVVGPVSLVWEGERPVWFPERFETLLCRYDMGDTAHFLGAGGYLLTTNSLFHRQTLLKLGGVRTDLGHRRKALIGGEDNDIFNRLIANHYHVYYQANALVFHPVPKERQTRRFLFRRLFWDGASQPLFEARNEKNEPASGVWTHLYRDARTSGRFALGALYGFIKGDRFGAQESLYRLTQRAGRIRTHLAMRNNAVNGSLAPRPSKIN